MHQEIRDHLEDYLRDPGNRNIPTKFHIHLAHCEACMNETNTLNMQTRWVRSLRAEEDIEPRAGFYARVMTRIEARAGNSFWAVFLDPPFGRRLAYTCAALVLLMGTYLFTTEPGFNLPSPSGVADVSADPSSNAVDDVIQPRQRDAVLVNLASYHDE